MKDRKIVAIVGATGGQGGGLARAILADPPGAFSVRAVTRRPESAAARELAALGAEIVAADLDRPETLKRAFDGAHAVFCVTNFWEHGSPERELTQAAAMANAVACAGNEHVIWSTLEDTRAWVPLTSDRMPTLLGRYKVPHFDAKGEANAEFSRRNVPATLLLTSFYWDNFINFPGMAPHRGPDGAITLTMPIGDKRLPSIALDDIGRCVYGILRGGPEYIGRMIGIAGEHLTGVELAAGLSQAIGERVTFVDVTPEAYRLQDFRGAHELGSMFQFKRDFEEVFRFARSVEVARELNPSLQTFEQWLRTNGSRIRVAG